MIAGITASTRRRASAVLMAPTDLVATLIGGLVKLTWTDLNTDETVHRIYRSSSPMDTQALPPPVTELGPDVTEWKDTDTPVDQVVYYIVSAVRGAEEAFSDEVMIDTTPVIQSVRWNKLDTAAGISLQDGDTVAQLVDGANFVHKLSRGTGFKSNGNWYVEMVPRTAISSTDIAIGVADAAFPLGFANINDNGVNAFYRPNGQIFYTGGGYANAGAIYAENDVIGVAYSAASGLVNYSKNGVTLTSVDIGTNLGVAPVGVFENASLNAKIEILSEPQYLPEGYVYWDEIP